MRLDRGPQDQRWLELVLTDTEALLCDHAHCERKAAATAMSLVARHPSRPRLVSEMATLAIEELAHFRQVHQQIVDRGGVLGPDPGDPYAKKLVDQVRSSSGEERLVERLLISALIESRSFQRLQLLGEHHTDPELRELFARFAREEARHGALFVSLARDVDVKKGWLDARLDELVTYEMELITELPLRVGVH